MKKLRILRRMMILVFCLSFGQTIMAQEKTGVRIAYNLNEIQGDFGQGIQLETPSLIKNYITLKVRASQMYLNHDQDGKNKWTTYHTAGFGISTTPAQITKAVSLYGEGGVTAIFPNSDFSSPTTEFGGYGLFGFNFNFDQNFCYFIELGGIGSGTTAEKSDNQRIYSNGFFLQVGFKIHFTPKEN